MKLSILCKKIFPLDISEIKKLASEITDEEWNHWDIRQKEYKTHSQTKSYPLMSWDLKYFQLYNICKITLLNKHSFLWHPVNNIKEKLESYYGGKCINILLTLMPPKSCIPKHIDNAFLLTSCHRCHIPIKTNKNVLFSISDKIYNLEERFCYEISNLDMHGVENNSYESRIHLIMDIIENYSDISIQFNS